MKTSGRLIRGLAIVAMAIGGMLTAAPSTAQADGIMFGLSAMKIDTSTSGPVIGEDQSATTFMNLKFGFEMASGLYVGGIYDMYTADTNGSKTERTGYGATLGFHRGGWFIDGSYFLSSTIEFPCGTKFEGGSGMGVDVGRNFDIASNVYLGLQLTYRSFEYTKAAGVDSTNKIKSELMPMINLGLKF